MEASSPHTFDSSVQPFLRPEFDAADYLNGILPALSLSSSTRTATTASYGRAVPLQELSTQLQTLLSQLNAQTSRLSTTLTQFTDEIIRSGGRLSYEVEVLRGETIALTDSLDTGLKKDIDCFIPTSLPEGVLGDPKENAHGKDVETERAAEYSGAEPEYLEQLRTLTTVRAKLDTVIKVFGEAMRWPIAPSELSLTSSLISVSAPESGDDGRSRERKGKEFAEDLRREINELVGSGSDMASLDAAAARIEGLRRLAEVWKGTAEEKARLRFVESLQKPVEEKQRALEKTSGARQSTRSSSKPVDYRYGNVDPSREGGYGFLQNLRNLKNDMYLE